MALSPTEVLSVLLREIHRSWCCVLDVGGVVSNSFVESFEFSVCFRPFVPDFCVDLGIGIVREPQVVVWWTVFNSVWSILVCGC